MRNILKLLLLNLFFATIVTSCQTDVSLTPIFPPTTVATEGQLIYQLGGIYNRLTVDQLYAQGFFGYLNAGADECFRNTITTTSIYPEIYNITNTDTNISALWRSLYQGVERANILLDVVDKAEPDSVKRNDYKGQAMFLRAYYFYLLVNYFGDVPLKTTLSTDMGTNFNLPRTPAKDVYSFIYSEMVKAEALVRSMKDVQSTSFVTKSAVQGVLARVCLSMAGNPINDTQKYNDALYWSQKVINSGIHSLNSNPVIINNFPTTPAYSKVFINNMQNVVNGDQTSEDIWDVCFLSKSNNSGSYVGIGYTAQTLGSNMGVYCPIGTGNGIIGYGSGMYRAFPKLYKLYGSGDLRRDWAIAPYMYKDATTNKYYSLTVNITGGNGTGATATAYTSSTGVITSIVVDNPGSGYTTTPTISFTAYPIGTSTTQAGTGSNAATATAVVSGGKVTAINVTKGGSGYPTLYERCVGKWRREYEINLPPIRQQNNTSCNFPVIRYADVLLMAAEADLMINGTPTATAVGYYNQVRRRAYGYTNVTSPVAGLDVSTFTLQDIMDERARELCFEGLRRSDLLRWGVMTKVMQDLLNDNSINAPSSYLSNSTLAAKAFLINPSKFSLFPIPSTELILDDQLVQNPGW